MQGTAVQQKTGNKKSAPERRS